MDVEETSGDGWEGVLTAARPPPNREGARVLEVAVAANGLGRQVTIDCAQPPLDRRQSTWKPG